jgi:hypothetical protein
MGAKVSSGGSLVTDRQSRSRKIIVLEGLSRNVNERRDVESRDVYPKGQPSTSTSGEEETGG